MFFLFLFLDKTLICLYFSSKRVCSLQKPKNIIKRRNTWDFCTFFHPTKLTKNIEFFKAPKMFEKHNKMYNFAFLSIFVPAFGRFTEHSTGSRIQCLSRWTSTRTSTRTCTRNPRVWVTFAHLCRPPELRRGAEPGLGVRSHEVNLTPGTRRFGHPVGSKLWHH